MKVDYLAVAAPAYAADFNNDGRVDALDLADWQGDFGVNSFSDANNDNVTDGADFLFWQREYGSGVVPTAMIPEPRACAILMLGMSLLGSRCTKSR